MISHLQPQSPAELGAALAAAAAAGQTLEIGGAFSKRRLGGPVCESDLKIATSGLRRVLQYDPRDLTISVEAGLPYAELSRLLAAEGQMLPFDPPCAATATIGGVVASGICGARRRLYGTARDMVIGMTYCTADGTLAESGGLVVKNVAGLDVQKALIGSLGTLALIASVNFKLAPRPESTRTFVLSFAGADAALAARDRVLASVLQPAALDLLSPAAAALAGLAGYCLLLRAGGSATLLSRYSRELAGAESFEADRDAALWQAVDDFAPSQPIVVRAGHRLPQLAAVLASTTGPLVARAGNGVSYLGFDSPEALQAWQRKTQSQSWSAVVEWADPDTKPALDQWPAPGPDLEVMRKLKALFDPAGRLNRGRLYGRI